MDDALEADHGKQSAGESAQPGQQQHGESNQARVAGRFPIVYLAHFFPFDPNPRPVVNHVSTAQISGLQIFFPLSNESIAGF